MTAELARHARWDYVARTRATLCGGLPLKLTVRALVMRIRNLLGIVLTTLPVAARASDCLSYDTAGTSVVGILSRASVETRSIGEHPLLVTITRWMLDTSSPFCVNGDEPRGDIAVSGTSSFELIPKADTALAPFIGKRVRVTGTFVPTYLPHYHAYLIMQVALVSENTGESPNKRLERP